MEQRWNRQRIFCGPAHQHLMFGVLERFFFQRLNCTDVDFLQLVERIKEKGACQAKRLRLRRNGVIHGEQFTGPNDLVRVTSQAIQDFSRLNSTNNNTGG